MYDKVKLYMPNIGSTIDIKQYLSNGKEQIDMSTGEVSVFGYLEGLRVYVYVDGFSIIGSLSKYLYPSNLYPLDRHSTTEAIQKMSDNLHVDMRGANVAALEFGTQFVMKKPVNVYLRKMKNAPRMQRCMFTPDTLYYRPKGKCNSKMLCFYDKGADAKAKGLTIPVGLEDANLLKYEMRLQGRLHKQLNVAAVTASTLSERTFYSMLVDKWQAYYFSISKSNQLKIDSMNGIKTPKDALDMLFARCLNQTDQSQIDEYIEELKEANVFSDRKAYTRVRNKIKEVTHKADFYVTDDDIRELDDEIKNTGAYI